MVYAYSDCHLSLKRKDILTHTATRTNLEDILHSEMSQTQKDKSCMIPSTRSLEHQIQRQKVDRGCQGLEEGVGS